MNSEEMAKEVAKRLRKLDEQARKEGWSSWEQKKQFERAEEEWLQEPDNR